MTKPSLQPEGAIWEGRERVYTRTQGKPRGGIDRLLLIIVVITVFYGFSIFMSAALGLYARGHGATFTSVLTSQAIGVLLGFVALFIASNIPYTFWKKVAVPLFVFSVILMTLVVMPGIGFLHGGSRRWIDLGPMSFQPADIFKVATVMLYAAWIVKHRNVIQKFGYAVAPLCILLLIAAVLLGLQPKFGTLIVMGVSLFSMFLISGARARHIALLLAVSLPLFFILLTSVPYVHERVDAFLNPENDPRGSSYQIKQSLIAIGSGGILGRGYGQSIQKFNFLPEPIGDSIFAVASEELGFIGALAIIVLITLFTYRSLVIASRTQDQFARLLVLGLVILITTQSFINISAMVGLFPLSGMPLVFISQGGTAMVTALGSVGIILNISKYSRLKQ